MTDVASATSSRRWRPVTRASRQPRQPAREWWERELFGTASALNEQPLACGAGGRAVRMTSSISVLAAFADGVILLALVAAAASPRVSPLARPLIASFALACAWALTAVFDALRAPGWTMLMGGAVIAVSIMVITVTIHLWTLGGGNESSLGQRGDQGEVGHDVVGRMLRDAEVVAATRTGGPSSSASLRSTLLCVTGRSV